MMAHGVVGRKRSFQQAVNTDVEHGRPSSSHEGRPGSDGRTPQHVHPLRGSKRSLVGTAQPAMHRSAGSSTELTALDAEGSLASTASAGAACETASPDAEHDSQVVGQQQESLGDGQDLLGTLPLPLPCGALCQLPCSQQSSATAAPDELKFSGYEGEHRQQQASSWSQCATQASDDLPLNGRGRGGTDAPSDRAGPELREVAAFQHPSAAGGHVGKGRRAHSDIVCDVQFSAGGDLIATAGVGKQVSYTVLCSHRSQVCTNWNWPSELSNDLQTKAHSCEGTVFLTISSLAYSTCLSVSAVSACESRNVVLFWRRFACTGSAMQ